MQPYTTRLQKGGALLPDIRRLLLEWDGSPGCGERIVRENVLGLPSRARASDLVMRTFVPRYVRSSPPDLWRTMQALERAHAPHEMLVPLHYYAAAGAEPLLWDFATQWLAPRYAQGQRTVTTADVFRFLDEAPASRFPNGRWSEEVTTRVARGLLAALRDFGVLEGAIKKRIVAPHLPVESFALLARLRVEARIRPSAILMDSAWRLFQLNDQAVERILLQAHQRGWLGYDAAGSIIRLEFPEEDVASYALAIAQRTH